MAQDKGHEVSSVTPEAKKTYYNEQLQGISPQALFVLGGGNRLIVDSRGRESYKTSPYKGKFFPDKTGGAKARPIAAVELASFFPDAKVVTMSHRPSHLHQPGSTADEINKYPSFAQILSADIQRMGVDKERIAEVPQSTSTLSEIMEIIKLSAERRWQNVAVITNDYQIERSQSILEMLKDEERLQALRSQLEILFQTEDEQRLFSQKWQDFEGALSNFKQANTNIVLISAEDVLRKRSRHYGVLIDELVSLPGYINVSKQEKEMADKIAQGEYNFAQDTFRQYILSQGTEI
ncbi:MAG: hypothetical protein A3A51_03130 [Candidatus Levybacteria bacterium RIFCSPLOWO2_01_FULL_39_10]|nr:MAG: hypothetical protein A3A51_03130 [Candidatus Levybacteria bacterium RIFCSPLOWO2_01_FULL_39_10]